MLIFMRTTLEIQDEVFRQAKSRAAEAGCSLGEFVTFALREALIRRETSSANKFSMPVFGDPAQRIERSLEQLSELRDEGR